MSAKAKYLRLAATLGETTAVLIFLAREDPAIEPVLDAHIRAAAHFANKALAVDDGQRRFAAVRQGMKL